MDINMVLEALEETVSEVGIHESIEELVDHEKTLSEYS
jgi:cell division control protein 6